MHYPVTSRQSAQDFEAAMQFSGKLVRKGWKRFGAQLFASLAAFAITIVVIGSAIVAPLGQATAASQAAHPIDQFVRGHVLMA